MPAKSKQQQRLFGLALSVKRGETPRSDVSDEVLDMVDSMSEDDIEDYASTKHKGLPTKKEHKTMKKSTLRKIIREEILKEVSFEKSTNSLNEDEDRENVKKRMKDIKNYLKKQKFSNRHELKNLKMFSEFAIEFELHVPGAPVLEFLVMDQSEYRKSDILTPVVVVDVSSPAKRGTFSKKLSGRNVTPEGVWKLIHSIWDGKFNRK